MVVRGQVVAKGGKKLLHIINHFITILLFYVFLTHLAYAEEIDGIWAKPSCEEIGPVKVINSFGIMDLIPINNGLRIQIAEFSSPEEESAQNNEALKTVKNINTGKEFEVELINSNGSLNGNYTKCNRLPNRIQWVLGEAAAGFDMLGNITLACTENSGTSCLDTAFSAVDVSNDGVLSRAELSRLIRILGFIAGYASKEEMLVSQEDVMISTYIAGAMSTFVADSIIGNLDYDDDGRISMNELLQDRGEGAGLADVGTGLTADVARDAIRTMITQIPSVFGKFLSL